MSAAFNEPAGAAAPVLLSGSEKSCEPEEEAANSTYITRISALPEESRGTEGAERDAASLDPSEGRAHGGPSAMREHVTVSIGNEKVARGDQPDAGSGRLIHDSSLRSLSSQSGGPGLASQKQAAAQWKEQGQERFAGDQDRSATGQRQDALDLTLASEPGSPE